MSDNYYEEQQRSDERNHEQDRENQRQQEYNREQDRQNDQRKSFNHEDDQRQDYNYEQDRVNEETENVRLAKVNDEINRELIRKGDISGFSIRNGLPFYVPGLNTGNSDEQPPVANSSDVQYSHKQKYELYRNKLNSSYLKKNTLLQEINNLSLYTFPYDPLDILRFSTSMRNNTLQIISDNIKNIDPESKEQVDTLDTERKIWEIEIPELSISLRDFVFSCQQLQFWKPYLTL